MKTINFSVLTAVLFSFFLFLSHNELFGQCGNYDTTYIEHDTTWTTTTIPPTFQGGTIIIEDGKTFTIGYGVTLDFHRYSGIISNDSPTSAVHLIVSGAVLLEGCGGGSNAWLGIRISGVPNADSNYTEYEYDTTTHTLTGNDNNLQSSVVINYATITQAEVGVQAINHAIVKIKATNFNSCYTGVLINDPAPEIHFSDILASSIHINCASYIDSCIFDIHGLVSALSSHLFNYKCVELDGTQYFEIMGNTFECSKGSTDTAYGRPTGIYADDANFSCHSTTGTSDPVTGCVTYTGTKTQNKFDNLTYGLYSTEDTVTNTIHLDDCKFQNCFISAYIKGGSHHTIHANTFSLTTSGSPYWDASVPGTYNNFVWLDHASNFVFYGNTLTEDKKHTALLYVDGSGTDQKNITKDSFINTVAGTYSSTDQEYGLYFKGDNRDQFVTCNYFSNHHYGIYCDATSLLSAFGTPPPGNEGVGNVFSAMSSAPCYWLYNANTSTKVFYNTHDPNFYNHVNVLGIRVDGSTTTTDSCSAIESCKKWPLGIKQVVKTDLNISVYPNPANTQLIFDFTNADMISDRNAKIEICDILGRVMVFCTPVNDSRQAIINTSKYADGVYIYRIEYGRNKQKTGKFEINH